MAIPCESAPDEARLDRLVAQRPHELWRGDRMARCRTTVLSSGHPALDAELPDRGWPRSVLTELLLPQAGIGEMHLLRPMLAGLAEQRRIALVQPPYTPHIATCQAWDVSCERLLWLSSPVQKEALWAAEQILRSGCFGALLLWQPALTHEALRRLHLAAQRADTLFWLFRPPAAQRDTSPAPLRLALAPANGGIAVRIVKRRGPARLEPLFLPLPDLAGLPGTGSNPRVPTRKSAHELLDRRAPATAAARSPAPELA